MDIVVPALQTSTTGSGGSAGFYDTIDSLYNVYTVRLLQLNKYNARNDGVDESQAFWGMGGIPERYNQCANWNADYSASTVSGTGALSLYSTTYDFTRNIAQIDTGNVKYALYRNTTFDSCIEFDDATFNINDIDLSGNVTSAVGLDTKGYIATSGGNKFLIVADATTVYSYPLDANNNIITGTVNTYACTVVTGSKTLRQVHVAAAIGDDIWIAQMEGSTNNAALAIRILTINSSGVFTNVVATSVADTAGLSGSISTAINAFGSYVKNNTCYIATLPQYSTGGQVHYFGSIDLTSTGSVSYTNILTYNSGALLTSAVGWDANIVASVGRDGTNIIYEAFGTVYTITGAGVVNAGAAINNRGFVRFRNTVAKLTTASLNFYSNESNKSFVYKGKQYGTWNESGVANLICCAYLMSGANEEDDATVLEKMICRGATQSSDGLDITLNGTTYGSDVNIIGEYAAILFDAEPVAATQVKLGLAFANSNAVDKKLGFGLTGGTYLSPTGANGLTGSTSTGADVSTAGSYLDLLFI